MKRFSIRKDDLARLRRAAAIEAEPKVAEQHITLDVIKYANLDDDQRPEDINRYVVNPSGSDQTDQADILPWRYFTSRARLDENGNGRFDFLIYNRYDREELRGNIVLMIENGQVASIHGYGDTPVLWARDGG